MADTKTVELEGKRYEVPSDASMDEIDSYIQSKSPGGGATLTKTAVPAYQPEFLPTLSREYEGAKADIKTGFSNLISPPGHEFAPVDNLSLNVLGAAQTGLGILRALSSPFVAAGSQVGETMGEAGRQGAEALGFGPTAQAVIGTAIGAPANVATQLVLAPQIISKAIPLAIKAVQGGAKMLPGAQVALREIGKAAISRLPSILKPAKSADQLFAELRAIENPSIALPEFLKTAKTIVKGEEELGEFGFANTQLASTAEKIKGALTPAPLLPSEVTARTQGAITPIVMGQSGYRGAPKIVNDAELRTLAESLGPATKSVSFDVIQKIRKRIGGRINDFRLSDTPGSREQLAAYKELYRDLSKDLEQASEKFSKLKEANKAANREFAIGELDDIFNATMGRAREGAEFTSSNFAQALNKIRDLRRSDELFAKGLGDVHLDSIERRLNELRKIKVLPPPKGQGIGSSLTNLKMGAGTGIGGTIGGLMAGPGGAAVGGSIGLATSAVAPMLISRIMQGPKASAGLIKLLRKTGEVSPVNFAALISLAKTEGIDDQTGLTNIMKSVETSIKDKMAASISQYNAERENAWAKDTLNRQ